MPSPVLNPLPSKITPNPAEVVRPSLPRLTTSSISDLSCPKKFRDTRLERNWDPNRGVILAVANGIACHRVLRQVYDDRCGPDLDLTRLDPLARDAVWGTSYPAGTVKEQATQRVIQSVRAFCESDDEESIEGTIPGGMERKGEFKVRDKRTGEALFIASARIDRAFVRASEPHLLCLRESKTTAQRLSLQESFLQMWVARKMFPGYADAAVEYDFLHRDDFRVERVTVTWEEAKSQSMLLLRKALRVFQAVEFPAIPGEACTYCRLRDECAALPDQNVDLDVLSNVELVP